MPVIPTRERTELQKNQPPRQNNIPPRVVYDPRIAPQGGIRYEQLRRPPARPQNERLSPIKPAKKSALPVPLSPHKSKPRQKKKKKEKERTQVHEFLLGFVVGLIIFGTAAIFICSALIGLFT